ITRRSGAAKALVEHPRGPAGGWHPGSPGRQDESRASRNARREVCAATSSWPQRAVALIAVGDTVLRRPTHPEVTGATSSLPTMRLDRLQRLKGGGLMVMAVRGVGLDRSGLGTRR